MKIKMNDILDYDITCNLDELIELKKSLLLRSQELSQLRQDAYKLNVDWADYYKDTLDIVQSMLLALEWGH